ncbi:MAG: heavy-metal-associated domain-containing protein [Microcystaceae cyanobacterium]
MTISLTVSSIACDGCAEAVTKAICLQDPNAQVTVDVPTKFVTIETTASETEIRDAIAKAGHQIA